jgi:hypothetical protein
MSAAIESIVSSYVKLNNRDALQELIAHRRLVLSKLKGVVGYNASSTIGEVEQEIAIVETGLSRLDRHVILEPSNEVARENELSTTVAPAEPDIVTYSPETLPTTDDLSPEGLMMPSEEPSTMGLHVSSEDSKETDHLLGLLASLQQRA